MQIVASNRIRLALGVLLIAGGLLGGGATFSQVSGVSAHDDHRSQPGAESPSGGQHGRHGALHEAMHNMMDQAMGAGFTERMHAAMPGSEALMETCASGMEGMMSGREMIGETE